MTDLDIVISAARNSKERLEDFYKGGTMRPTDEGAVAQCIGAFGVFLDELEMLRERETPR